MSEVPLEGRIKTVYEQFGKNLKISMSIRKDTLDCSTTKDKGKAALTAIQYSAPDRAIPFTFYNHPQTLWVWVDGTSISLGNVDPTRGHWIKDTCQYKRKSKNPEERARKNSQKLEPPSPPPGERLLGRTRFNYV